MINKTMRSSSLRGNLRILALFGVVLVWGWAASTACGPRCIPGASIRCACPNNADGAQSCQADGTYAACRCGDNEPTSDAGTETTQEKSPSENATETTLSEPSPETVAEKTTETPITSEASPESTVKESSPESPPETINGVQGLALFQRLSGLWVGMASRTPLGNFAMTTMDFRDASPHVLFSRADLDAQNNLRFAFSIETHGGKDVLIYRNGGYFLGLLRDSRTELIAYDPAKSSWRFCAVGTGCSYIDATFTFPAADQMVLDVKVRGRDHMYWQAERKETRTLPQTFPKDTTSQGPGNAPFPPMPLLTMSLTWAAPLTQDASVWFVLSTTACGITLQCNASRSIRVPVKVGAMSASIEIQQLHVGKYLMNAILDRNNNAATTFFPDSGDGVAQPDTAVDVKANQSNSASAFVIYNLP